MPGCLRHITRSLFLCVCLLAFSDTVFFGGGGAYGWWRDIVVICERVCWKGCFCGKSAAGLSEVEGRIKVGNERGVEVEVKERKTSNTTTRICQPYV